jgi:hypothetical protein
MLARYHDEGPPDLPVHQTFAVFGSPLVAAAAFSCQTIGEKMVDTVGGVPSVKS